jgi:sugar (pentulose or hexulose) kinase
MSTKHTPGQWRSGKPVRIGNRLWEAIISSVTGRTIALVDRPEDAALIAAASEMREELDAAQKAFDATADSLAGASYHTEAEKLADMAMRFRALLARIDGQA